MPKAEGKISTSKSIESSKPEENLKVETDVKDELDQMKDTLKSKKNIIEGKQTESKRIENEIEQLSKQIGELESLSTEANKMVVAYGKTLENINPDITAIQNYYDTKWPQIELANQDKKGRIEAAINYLDEEIKKIQENLSSLEGEGSDSVTTAEANYNTAQKNLERQQKNYDELKTFQKTVEGTVKDLKDLKKSIEDEENKGNLENTYALIKDMNRIFENKIFKYKDVEIKTKEKLMTQLSQAWVELKAARIDAGTKEIERNSKREEQKKLIQKLIDANKNRRGAIFEGISRIKNQV